MQSNKFFVVLESNNLLAPGDLITFLNYSVDIVRTSDHVKIHCTSQKPMCLRKYNVGHYNIINCLQNPQNKRPIPHMGRVI